MPINRNKNASWGDLKDSLESANVRLRIDYLIAVYQTSAPNFDIVNIPGYAEIVRFENDNIRIYPVTEKFLNPLKEMRYYAKQEKRYYFKNSIPGNLIYINTITGDMLWKIPAKSYTLNSEIENFKGVAHFPDLVALLKNEELFVYAENPKSKDLHVLSIPHYDDKTGWVCLGEVKKSFEIEERIRNYNLAWERNRYVSMAHTHMDDEVYPKIWSKTYFSEDPWNTKKFKHLKKCQQTIQTLLESIT